MKYCRTVLYCTFKHIYYLYDGLKTERSLKKRCVTMRDRKEKEKILSRSFNVHTFIFKIQFQISNSPPLTTTADSPTFNNKGSRRE